MTKDRKFNVNKLNVIIAIVIAFVAWVYVIYNYSPMKEVTYQNVPVSFTGEDTLAAMGYGVESTSVDTITVRLNIHRKDFRTISSENIVVVADVSDAVEGENGISLEVLPPENCKLVSQSQDTATVKVGYSELKDVDLIATFSDATAEDNIEPLISNVSRSSVRVVGAKKNVERVKYAAVQFKMAELNDDDKHFVVTPIAVDSRGNKVPHVVVLPNEVSLKARAGVTKTVALDLKINNYSHDEINYTAPNKITIKATEATLKSINKIDATADITGAKEGTEVTIYYQLPDGVSIANASIGQCVKVLKEN